MRFIVVILCACASAVAQGYDTVGGIGPAAEYEEYQYHLPVNEATYANRNPITELSGGGQVAAAVTAVQHAHQSHYTKPSSTGIKSVTPISIPYTYRYPAVTHIKGAAKAKVAKKQIPFGIGDHYNNAQSAVISKKPGIVSDAEPAQGYQHHSYYPPRQYELMPGYGYSGGYPRVGYGNHGASFGQYGYNGLTYGGYPAHGLGFVGIPTGYALGGIAHNGVGGAHGYGGGYPHLGHGYAGGYPQLGHGYAGDYPQLGHGFGGGYPLGGYGGGYYGHVGHGYRR